METVVDQQEKTGSPEALEGSIRALEAELKAGSSYKTACEKVGFSYQKARAWMIRGGRPMGGLEIGEGEEGENEVDPNEEAREPYRTFARRLSSAWSEGSGYRVEGGPLRAGTAKGRPPREITSGDQEVFLARLREGFNWTAAIKGLDVNNTTLLAWLRLGGHEGVAPLRTPVPRDSAPEPYRSFVTRVLEAEAEASARDGFNAA